jgi:glycosyltransferase involved in cell wall biosynthesis
MTKDNKMRVAFFAYPSAFQNIGGGEILLIKTKEYLEKEGVYCRLFDVWSDKLEDFDILHIIGSVKDSLGLMHTAKNKGLKIVLDPVFFSTFERSLHEYGGFARKSAACARHMTKVLFPSFPSSRRKMMELADIIVPNSDTELRQLKRLFAIERDRMRVIPNCVDAEFAGADPSLFISKYGIRDFILSVGRIEPRKNQLNLIKALKGSPSPLVIIGDPVSDYVSYYEECKKEGAGKVVFIGRMDHSDPVLKSAYGACKCFVSQGWFETPGLVALEAGLAGANIATTNKGCTEEYFKGFAEYFNPSDISGIKKAVEKAFRKEKAPGLKEHIKNNFLWPIAAKKNVEVYKEVLGIR